MRRSKSADWRFEARWTRDIFQRHSGRRRAARDARVLHRLFARLDELLKRDLLEYVATRQATNWPRRVTRLIDCSIGSKQKAGCVKERVISRLGGSTGCCDNGLHINVAHGFGVSEAHPGEQLRGGLDAVDGDGNHTNLGLTKNQGIGVEVNQLLTTIWSPVASVEKHSGPSAGRQLPDRHLSAIEILSGDLGKC